MHQISTKEERQPQIRWSKYVHAVSGNYDGHKVRTCNTSRKVYLDGVAFCKVTATTVEYMHDEQVRAANPIMSRLAADIDAVEL